MESRRIRYARYIFFYSISFLMTFTGTAGRIFLPARRSFTQVPGCSNTLRLPVFRVFHMPGCSNTPWQLILTFRGAWVYQHARATRLSRFRRVRVSQHTWTCWIHVFDASGCFNTLGQLVSRVFDVSGCLNTPGHVEFVFSTRPGVITRPDNSFLAFSTRLGVPTPRQLVFCIFDAPGCFNTPR
jgi:hypothetical protein